jgi:carbamoyltransferase
MSDSQYFACVMIILSFHSFVGGHDTSAALVRDGRLIAAAEEERFSRCKHESGLPYQAIDYCLREAGVKFRDVDMIAFPDTPFRTGPNSGHAEGDLDFFRRMRSAGLISRRSLVHKRVLDFCLRKGMPVPDIGMHHQVASGLAAIREHYGELPPIWFVDHHRAHAAAAFFTSGLTSAAVVTIDGRGGNYATAVWHARGTRLERLRAEPWTNSLGAFYDACTHHLGFGALQSGKTMGLASYGDPDRFANVMARLLSPIDNGLYEQAVEPLDRVMGFPRRNGDDALSPPYPDFAAAAQDALQRAIDHTVKLALEETGESALCLGGGVAYNCTSNGALLAAGTASSVWVFPASGDAGLSVGAALACAAEKDHLTGGRLDTAYLGPEFTRDEMLAAIREEQNVEWHTLEDPPASVARLIADGNVVGWFQGRMELGPRALGNRSILADPRSTAVRDKVNDIKRRERWRPLAPAVLAERAAEYFELDTSSDFMLFAAQVRPEKRPLVAGVVHVDGSARPQTVHRSQNPPLHELISAFEKLTGIPIVMNTSFNDAGEPIVCTPRDAIRSFLITGLDALVLGDILVTRRKE